MDSSGLITSSRVRLRISSLEQRDDHIFRHLQRLTDIACRQALASQIARSGGESGVVVGAMFVGERCVSSGAELAADAIVK